MSYTIRPGLIEEMREARPGYLLAFTDEEIEDYCCDEGWSEGDEHQEWLDTASPDDIALWVSIGLWHARDAEEWK